MPKRKQRWYLRLKLRSKSKTCLMKKRKCIRQLQCSSVVPPKPLMSPCTQNKFFRSWPSALYRLTEAVKPLLITTSRLCGWCQKAVTHIFQIIKNSVFQSHTCEVELHSLKERLEKLEIEFSRLQSLVQDVLLDCHAGSLRPELKSSKLGLQNVQSSQLEVVDKDESENRAVTTLPENLPIQNSKSPLRALTTHMALSVVEPVSLTSQSHVPPAPPPPPPLPPLPPPPAPVFLKKTGGLKTQVQAASLKKGVPMQITIHDLLNVKLKKIQSGAETNKRGSPSERRKALVTLLDLQSVSLKPKAPQLMARVTNHLITPSRTGLDLRKHLKKVAIDRSPGGTPMTNKENVETGTGLTPIMTQALRRKFQLAHPKSPSPARLTTGSSFEECS